RTRAAGRSAGGRSRRCVAGHQLLASGLQPAGLPGDQPAAATGARRARALSRPAAVGLALGCARRPFSGADRLQLSGSTPVPAPAAAGLAAGSGLWSAAPVAAWVGRRGRPGCPHAVAALLLAQPQRLLGAY